MAQITSGLRSILSLPRLYQLQQFVWGSPKLHAQTRDRLALRPGQTILDIGCGPADILKSLGQVDYTGVDLSASYIASAQSQFGKTGTFLLGDVYKLPGLVESTFDAILAQSLLHHLDDQEVVSLFHFAAAKLAPGGHLVTADPCYYPGQGKLERFLINHDRGQNVRSPDAYQALASQAFGRVRVELCKDAARFPYTYCYLIANP